MYGYSDHRDLHVLTPSFPTRRSTDLQRVRNDDEQAQPARNLRPAEARVAQKAFVAPLADALDLRCLRAAALKEARHQSVSSSSRAIDRNSSGETRIAAPVGHARTHAGPPEMPLHMSHFTAIFLGFSSPHCFLVHLGDGSPGPGPKAVSSPRSRLGFSGGAASLGPEGQTAEPQSLIR